MKTAEHGDTVKVHYTGTLEDGTVFDSSVGQTPLEFTIGEKQVLQGFEEGVLGLSIGGSNTIHIPAKEAYGLRQENLIGTFSRGQLPESITPEIGMKLQMQSPEGDVFLISVIEIEGDDITFDANHELAGEDLNFDIELVEIN